MADETMTGYIWMVTLSTGDGHRVPRSAVADDVISALRPTLAAAVAAGGGRVAFEPGPPDLSLQAFAAGRHLTATLWDDTHETPLMTISVAGRSIGAAKLWGAAHTNKKWVVTDAADVPAAPWAAVLPYPGLPHARPDITIMTADIAQCLAWAWMESK